MARLRREPARVLRWIIERCEGRAHAVDTPIGALPLPEDIDTTGLDMQPGDLEALLSVDKEAVARGVRFYPESTSTVSKNIFRTRCARNTRKSVDQLG